MAREVVKTLEGRELELLLNAAVQVRAAQERIEQARAEATQREQSMKSLLEMATGLDPTGFSFDLGTGEVTQECRKASGKKPSKGATTK